MFVSVMLIMISYLIFKPPHHLSMGSMFKE
jgi:hypothetical protein